MGQTSGGCGPAWGSLRPKIRVQGRQLVPARFDQSGMGKPFVGVAA